MANYRLCRVTEATPSKDGCVRTVWVAYLPKNKLSKATYNPADMEWKEVAVQRLALIVPSEDINEIL